MSTNTIAPRTVYLCRDRGTQSIAPQTSRLASPRAAAEFVPPGQPRLTGRQLEVLSLLCEGFPNKIICRRLDIAAGTVKVHISSIFRELGVTSRLQAVVAAHRLGLMPDVADVRGSIASSARWGASMSGMTQGL